MMQAIAYSMIAILVASTATILEANASQFDDNHLKFDNKRRMLRRNEESCPVLPPFPLPYPVFDSKLFEQISSCPFQLHQQTTGREVRGCFPIYRISQSEASGLPLFKIDELNVESQVSLVFKTKYVFANREDLAIMSNSSTSKLGQCLTDLSFEAVGLHGEVSGENGTVNIDVVAVTFSEYEEENTVLLPIGGCELDSRNKKGNYEIDQANLIMTRQRSFEEFCSILPERIGRDECFRNCHSLIESEYKDKIDELVTTYESRILKNDKNKDAILRKLLITRTRTLITAFTRCKCKHNNLDLGHCLLYHFLDVIVGENNYQFEVEQSFDEHTDEVDIWFQTNGNIICDTFAGAVQKCYDDC